MGSLSLYYVTGSQPRISLLHGLFDNSTHSRFRDEAAES